MSILKREEKVIYRCIESQYTPAFVVKDIVRSISLFGVKLWSYTVNNITQSAWLWETSPEH